MQNQHTAWREFKMAIQPCDNLNEIAHKVNWKLSQSNQRTVKTHLKPLHQTGIEFLDNNLKRLLESQGDAMIDILAQWSNQLM